MLLFPFFRQSTFLHFLCRADDFLLDNFIGNRRSGSINHEKKHIFRFGVAFSAMTLNNSGKFWPGLNRNLAILSNITRICTVIKRFVSLGEIQVGKLDTLSNAFVHCNKLDLLEIISR